MLIRTELLQPNVHVFGANQYLTLVGLHGSMMMGIMTSGILGPFANWLVPLMIGSRRMAFPRIESFTFWLLMAGAVILLTTIFFGGFQTGWTGYQPLGDQGTAGYDAYIGFFALVGLSMTLFGFNLMATIITMRAPGMTWSRLPIFVWAALATAALMMLAAPMLIAALLMGAMDRTVQTAFYVAGQAAAAPTCSRTCSGSSAIPEVYVLALPGFGIVLELLPVFARKPLWGYRLAVAGMLGVAFLSFFVWQHHLFVSGINADLRPFYMLSTELISLPTGFIFLCAMGTLWRGRIRFTVPMLFCLAWVFNFLWGGISGVFLSDVPSDVTTHGSFFVMAHFHYTIMGGLVFAFFAGIYYWVPKMYGFKFNETLAKVHFWVMFIAFNSTFAPLFALGFLGMPRRVVTYTRAFQGLNDWVSVSAFVLGLSMLVFLVQRGLVAGDQARAGGGQPVALEVGRVAAADAGAGARLRPDPRVRRGPLPVRRRAGAAPAPVARRPEEGARPWKPRPPPMPLSSPSRAEWQPRALWVAGGCCAARSRSSSPRSCSPTSTCGRWTRTTLEDRRRPPLQGARGGDRGAVRRRRGDLPAGGQATEVDVLPAGIVAIVMSLVAVALQFFEYTTLDFGAAIGGYASVFIGWTALYAIVALLGIYWIETQMASLWRVRRGTERPLPRDRGCRPIEDDAARGVDRGVLVLLGVLRGHRLSWPGSSSTSSDHEPHRLVAGPVARLRRMAAVLYLLGSRGTGRPEPLQAAAFFAGLLTIVIALDSPIDAYADQLFWVHMLQHVLLLTVAPPLFLLGRPWPRMWRALPLGPRDAARRARSRESSWTAPLRALARPLPGVDPVQRDRRRLAHPRRLRRDAHQRRDPRVRARDVLLHRAAVLGPRDRPRAAAPAAGVAGADRLHRRRDGRRLDPGDHARGRPAPALRLLRGAGLTALAASPR